MASICAADMNIICTHGTAHQFKINYAKIKDMNIGEHVTSPTFKSGGHQWAIEFYPKGGLRNGNEGVHASLFLTLLDDHKGLEVSFTLGILEEDDCETEGENLLFKRRRHTFSNSAPHWGLPFTKRATLEGKYLTNGFFVVLCAINVKNKVTSDLPQSCSCGALEVSKLWDTGEMADVKFEVEGEVFSAHRVVLGARSPVFKAELFGSMSETRMECITIKDMKPEVFKALLHFVYTSSLPDGFDGDMFEHLIVAADRYAIEGLIMVCEQRLIENISLDRVLGILICADRHDFKKLKNACLQMAGQQNNFNELALTQEYCAMMQEFPSLLSDLRKRIIPS